MTDDKMSLAALYVLMKMSCDNKRATPDGWRTLPVENLSKFSHEVGPLLERMGLLESTDLADSNLRLYRLSSLGVAHVRRLVEHPVGGPAVHSMMVKVDLDEKSLASAIEKVRAATASTWRYVTSGGLYELDSRVVLLRFSDVRACADYAPVRVNWATEEASVDGNGELCSLQASEQFNSEWCVVYRGCGGSWIRPVREFFDGRFVRVRL